MFAMGRSPQASKVATRGKWSTDTRLTAQVVGGYALIIVLAALLFRGPGEVDRLPVQGVIRGTRIVPDHALETKWGSQLTWKAEIGSAIPLRIVNTWYGRSLVFVAIAKLMFACSRGNLIHRVECSTTPIDQKYPSHPVDKCQARAVAGVSPLLHS